MSELDRARDALHSISPGGSRDEWVRAGMAAQAAGLSFEDFNEWSARADSYEARAARDAWKSFKPDGRIGPGTLFHLARSAGWKEGKERSHGRVPAKASSRPVEPRKPMRRALGAAEAFERFKPAPADHAYIVAKQGRQDGLRVVPDTDPLRIAGQAVAGWLAVPVLPLGGGDPVSLQFIPPPGVGKKLNLPGAAVAGVFIVGELVADGDVFVCEGIGQAWACWQATGSAAVVCFGWGRVAAVAGELRARYPAARLVLVPDVGKEAEARRIAQAVAGTSVGLPEGWPINADVNDYAQREGFDALDLLLTAAQPAPALVCHDEADPTDIMPLIQKNIEDAGRLGADFADPVAAANCIVATLYTKAGRRVLHFWQGEFHFWARSHYSILPLADVREMLYSVGPVLSVKPVKKRSVDDVLDALKAAANLSHRLVPSVPAWVDRQASDLDPRAVIPVRNGLVCVESGQLLAATPRLFVPYALPFDYAPDAADPMQWLRFLASVWCEDQESIDALQEWLGYLLTADTSRQKALMIVGPRRSGKGTIGRVIVQLLGDRNVASPTLASLGNNFGLEPLIGKTAALMSDARLGARADIAAVAENLLRLTGEDTISVDRKFKEAYSAKLLARVVVLTNELPVFRDAASALPSRFILLRTARSFYGQEDHGLDGKLAAELPGILVWALAGLRRLRQRGRFVQPAAGAAQLQMMEDLASPISTFVRDACIVEPGGQVPIAKLYEAWRDWCKEHGRDQPGTEQTFGRDIAAAVPSAGHSRPRINGARVRMYNGLRLRTPDDPSEDEDDEA